MRKMFLITSLICAVTNAEAAPVSPIAPKAAPVPAVEVKPLATEKKEEADLLKNIDAVLSGKFDKASEYRPPLPLTQKAWSRQKTETRAGNKVFVWGRRRQKSDFRLPLILPFPCFRLRIYRKAASRKRWLSPLSLS